MKFHTLFFASLCFCLLTGCYPDEELPVPFTTAFTPDPATEFVVFGRHSLGPGEHDLFLLTRTGLYKDAPEFSPESERRYQPEPLPDSLFQMALPLFDYPVKLREQRIWGQDDFGGTPVGKGRNFLRAGPGNGDFQLFFHDTDETTPDWAAPLLRLVELSYCNSNHYRSRVNRCGR
ncbi:MAG: hypothetical protein AAFN92_19110 [Bacteroidota bacterium]